VRIVVFSERLRAPYDEGIKNFTVQLIRALATKHDVLALTSGGLDDAGYDIRNVDANRLLLSARLRNTIRTFQPGVILYVPTACGTVFSFVRARMLQLYGQGAPTVLIILQPRHYTVVGRFLVGRLAPSWVLAQSTRTAGLLGHLGCRTALLPPAVDARRFSPAAAEDKAALRKKYGVSGAAIVAAHVGHLKGKRNLSHLVALQSAVGFHTVVVGSTSTGQDAALLETLQTMGATVINSYVPNIEDIYRLSDAYVFLAEQDTAAIELPLSILEAMACNLPVVCTPFGGLPDFFEEGHGLFYWNGEAEIRDMVEGAVSTPCATRALVESRTWSALAQELLGLLQENRDA
jgi:glycosyltransferase involved in cell wall biosynthesis